MKEVMIHEPRDEIYTIAADGSVRKFTVLQNGDLVLDEGPRPDPLPDPDQTAVMQAPQIPIDDRAARDLGIPRGGRVPSAEDVLRAFCAVKLQGSPNGQLAVSMSEVFRYMDTRLVARVVPDENRWLIRWP